MQGRIWITGWGLLLLAATLLGSGCTRSKGKSHSDGDGRGPVPVGVFVDVPDAPPQELAAVMDAAMEEAKELAQKPDKRDEDDAFLRQVFTGMKAADMIVAHADADEEARKNARQTKLSLLYLGACTDGPMFEQRLVDFAEEVAAADPHSEQAAMAAACAMELRHIGRNKPKGEVMARLVEYAETYPASTAGVELFRMHGKQLESNQDRDGAIRCYEKGVALYQESPGIDRLTEPLRGLQQQQARERAGRVQQQAAHQAKVKRIKQQLGNCEEGYFVIYAEQNVKPPRRGGMYFYRYEYEVLCGANSAASYILGLPEKYSWKLIRRFPQTPAGRENAYNLWKKLLKEKRYGKKKK